MWIYLLIGLLFLILAVEGYFKGGVNGVITLLGVIIAINFQRIEVCPGLLATTIGDFPPGIVSPVLAILLRCCLPSIIGGEHHHPQTSGRSLGRIPDRQLQGDEPQIRFLHRPNHCDGLLRNDAGDHIPSGQLHSAVPTGGWHEGMLAMLNESRVQLDNTLF